MVTKESKAGLYDDLFAKANRLLTSSNPPDGFPEGGIQTIDDYFRYIKTIVDRAGESAQDYLILPVDEDFFEINANTRKIIVPPSFANGASVVGDEIAEVIYFSIDRYFDTTDFFSEDIFPIIQWTNAAGESGSSRALPKTVNVLPNKVVFGWALSSEITKKPGPIQFSVRFYSYITNSKDERELTYSFSTLTATIRINPSLDLEVIENIDFELDKMNDIIKRLKNSPVTSPEFKAVAPVFERFESDPVVGETRQADLEDGKITFIMKAVYPTGTPQATRANIKYYLYRQDRDGKTPLDENFNPIPEGSVTEDPEGLVNSIYVLSTDKVLNTTKKYYTYNEAEDSYEIYVGEVFPGPDPLYEVATTIEATKAGTYYAVAQNYLADNNNASAPLMKSLYITVPFPGLPKFSDLQVLSGILDNETSDCLISMNVIDPEDDNNMTYDWFYSPAKENLDNAEKVNETALSAPEILVSNIGYYFVKATNTRNNDSVSVDSKSTPIWVTRSATKLEFNYSTNEDAVYDDSIGAYTRVNVTFYPDSPHTAYNMRYVSVPDLGEVTYQLFYEDDRTIQLNEDSKDARIKFYPNMQPGNYYCVMTHTYNTSVAKTESIPFVISSPVRMASR